MPAADPQPPPACQYRQLGTSGLRVSVPILGCLGIGDPTFLPWVLDEAAALPLLKAAYDRGVNTWDTANCYSNGASEELVGKAIKHYGIPRHRVVIMTKCYTAVDEAARGRSASAAAAARPADVASLPELQNQCGLSRAALFNQVDASLRRLDTPYIDVLQVHRFDAAVAPEETMRALDDLVRSGKVRYIGASSMWATQFARLQTVAEGNGWTRFISMQNYYNLLYREEEREMNRYCRETGVGLIPWSPLEGGRLCRPVVDAEGVRGAVKGAVMTVRAEAASRGLFPGRPRGEWDGEIIRRVEEVSRKKGCSMAQVSLAWLMRGGRVVSPIIGAVKMEHLEEAILAANVDLSDEEEKYLEELHKPCRVYGHV